MDASPSCAVPRLSNVTALPRLRKGDDGVEESSRDDAPTGHVLNRGTTNRDAGPQFDDLRPLVLQEPKWRGGPLESAYDPKATYRPDRLLGGHHIEFRLQRASRR